MLLTGITIHLREIAREMSYEFLFEGNCAKILHFCFKAVYITNAQNYTSDTKLYI